MRTVRKKSECLMDISSPLRLIGTIDLPSFGDSEIAIESEY